MGKQDAEARARFAEKMDDFAAAAEQMSIAWERLPDETMPNEGYPSHLPSFDEFVAEIFAWRDKVRARMIAEDIYDVSERGAIFEEARRRFDLDAADPLDLDAAMDWMRSELIAKAVAAYRHRPVVIPNRLDEEVRGHLGQMIVDGLT
jgi:hypothetical protein